MSKCNDPAAELAKEHGAGFGLMIGALLQLAAIAVLILLLMYSPVGNDSLALALACIGLSQLMYMFPAIFVAHKFEQRGIAKGLAITVLVTFMLNAGCWGLAALNSIH